MPRMRTTDKDIRRARDGYNNLIARLGSDQPNALSSGYYAPARLTSRWQELTEMYRTSWLTKKIIDTPAEDMTKAWISLDTQMNQDAVRMVEREMRQFNVQDRMKEALKWSRLYGGAAAIILIEGEEDMMDQPLDLALVMPGTFRGLLVVDRWNGIVPGSEIVDDMADKDYGLPKYYDLIESSRGGIGSGSRTIRVHHSRVIRFVGRSLPCAEEEAEMFWGASEMEHVADELSKRNATSANIAQLVFQANLRVLKMNDLGQVLAMSDERTQQELYQTIQAQNMLMTSFGLQLMDQSDSFETHPYAFSGLNDIYQSFMSDVAGAAEIPATKLFGKSPDGMNATGEGDLTNYYDSINQKQESILRPALEKLMPVLCVSALGVVPDDIEIVFEPVESATANQKADLATKVVTAISTLFASDIITKAMAMKELRKSSFQTGIGSTITDEDIEKAEKEASLPPEEDFSDIIGGMGGGKNNPPQREDKEQLEGVSVDAPFPNGGGGSD